MAFYIIPYIYLVAVFGAGILHKVRARALLFFCMIPAIAIVVLRGDVGTDTASYIHIFSAIRQALSIDNIDTYGVEFGFALSAHMLLFIGLAEHWVVAIFSFLVCFLAVIAFSRTRDDAIVFVLLVFPIFFYDMSMNGLRYGIAFCLAKMAYDLILKKSNYVAGICILLAFSFHVSSILLLALLIVRGADRKIILYSACLAVVAVIFYYDRIAIKILAYMQLESPNALSGLAPLLISLLVYLLSLFFSAPNRFYLGALIVFEICAFILAKYTYAGLRLQILVLFALCCSMPSFNSVSSKQRLMFLFGMLLIGITGFAAMGRSMVNGEAEGDSPFLPYHFFWEAR